MNVDNRKSPSLVIALSLVILIPLAMLALHAIGMHNMSPIEYMRTLPYQVAIGWLVGAVGGLVVLNHETKDAVLLSGYLGGYVPAFCALGYLGWGVYHNFL